MGYDKNTKSPRRNRARKASMDKGKVIVLRFIYIKKSEKSGEGTEACKSNLIRNYPGQNNVPR